MRDGWWSAGLHGSRRRGSPPGTLAFVAVMLGSVAFDGFSQTDALGRLLRGAASLGDPALTDALADAVGMLLACAGLLLMVTFVALAYIVAMKAAAAAVHYDRNLTDAFLGSLVPIALAYVVAHYFSSSSERCSTSLPSPPTPSASAGTLIGTADVKPRIAVLAPKTIWYVQVAALVIGHVAGLVLAHDRGRRALRVPTQGGHQPVRDAGAHGCLHARRPLALVAVRR